MKQYMLLLFVLVLSVPCLASTVEIEKPGRAVTVTSGDGGFSISSSLFPDEGAVIDYDCVAQFSFYLPNIPIDSITVRIYGGNTTLRRLVIIGNGANSYYEALPTALTENVFTYSGSNIPSMFSVDNGIGKKFDITFFNDFLGTTYSLKYIKVSYSCSSVPQNYLSVFQSSYSSYLMLNYYKNNFINGTNSLWTNNQMSAYFFNKAFREMESYAQNLYNLSSDGIFDKFKAWNAAIDNWLAVSNILESAWDCMEFWGPYPGYYTGPNLRTETPNRVDNATEKMSNLSQTWFNAMLDGSFSSAETVAIGTCLQGAQTGLIDLQSGMTAAFNEMHRVYMSGSGDATAELLILSMQPFVEYDYKIANPTIRADSVLPAWIQAMTSWVNVLPHYTIQASSGSYGSLNPSGTISVVQGGSQLFTATPNSGYVVDVWVLNGKTVQYGGTSYTVSNIQANCNLSVSFAVYNPGTNESNNSYQTAGYLGIVNSNREYESLSITSGDVDYYRFTLENTGTADDYIHIGLDGSGKGSSDIDLALGKLENGDFGPADCGNWIDVMSRNETKTETVSLNGHEPGEYFAIVFGALGFDFDVEKYEDNPNFAGTETGTYYLIINAPDVYEDDDTAGQAKTITTDGIPQRHSLANGSEDIDWVTFTLSQNSDVSIQLAATIGDAMKMTLYGPNSSSSKIAEKVISSSAGSCVISRTGYNYLSPGTYYLQVCSDLVDDIPKYSISVSATTAIIPVPQPPASITYPSTSNTGIYNVEWASSACATSYQLERSNDDGVNWIQIYSNSAASYPENIGNGSYRYRVKATNASGSSGWKMGTGNCNVSTPYTLNLTKSGNGSVKVNGTLQSLPWSGTFSSGTNVALEAISDTYWQFSTWSGDLSGSIPTSILMNGNKNVTANFTQPSYTLNLSKTGNGSVKVDGTFHSLPWSGSFIAGTNINLEAIPDDGWLFNRWSGTITTNDNPASAILDNNHSISADFIAFKLTDPNGQRSVIANKHYLVRWIVGDVVQAVKIDYSTNNGVDWIGVSPPNTGNSGQYVWLVPNVTSDQCLVRISDASNPLLYDISDSPFKIYPCNLPDLTGDCVINLEDIYLMMTEWLECGNPYDPECL